MKFSATFVALSILAVSVSAAPQMTRRATVAELAATQQGKKVVFTPCASDSECQQGCCGFSSGKCAGPAVAQTNGSGGCGRGTAVANCNVATLLGFPGTCIAGFKNTDTNDPQVQAATAFSAQLNSIPFTPSVAAPAAPPPPPPAANNAAAPAPAAGGASVAELAASQQSKKTVFEACGADSECQQGCCGFNSGKCAGPAVAQTNGSGGCGRGTAAPNCNVATLLGFPGTCISGFKNTDTNDRTVQAATAFSAQLNSIKFTPTVGGGAAAAPPPPAGNNAAAPPAAAGPKKSVAELAASQQGKKTVFIECASDSECQQGCCGFNSGKCAGPAVAQTNGSGGCGRGTAAPNCNVATLLGFPGTCIAGARNGDLKDPLVQAATAFSAQLNSIGFTPA
ncbi:hypothetical protein MIND_00769000 [Mycena indigotica]|uniref:Biotrophy-associated secreted protein 2 n=1 Tax=Mycena indigotica TaxID=2126181 RepID=A0A8H6W3Y5_9AGAR|nr:uncharacterized protein MIND_00769000 [Mycena indigotica]KAF7302026.1 hypothetical protein MIND_00769000 [Mycena indigotica]